MDFLINEQPNTDLVKQQQFIHSNQTQLLQIAKENQEELLGSLIDIKLPTPPESLPCSPDSSNLNQPFYSNLIDNKNKEENNQLNNMLTTHHQTVITKLNIQQDPTTPPRTPSDDSPITSSTFGNAISTSAEVLSQSQQLLDSKNFPFNVLNNAHTYEQQQSVADAFTSNLFRANGQINGSQTHDQLYNMLGGGNKTANNEQHHHHQMLNDNHWFNPNQSQNILQQQMAVAAVTHPLTAHHTLNNSLNVDLINHGLNTSNNSNLNCTSGSEEETQAVSSSSVSPNLQQQQHQQHQQQSTLNNLHNQTGNNQITTNQSLNGLTFTNQITNSLTEHHLNYYQSTSLHHTTDNNFILPRSAAAILPMHNGQTVSASSPHHHNITNQLVHNQQNQLVNHQTPINQLSNRLPINNSNSDTFNQFIQQQHPNHQLNHQSLHLANLPNHHGLFHHHNTSLNSPITHSNTRCSTRFNQNSTSATNQRNNLLNNQHEQNLNLNSMQYETNSNSSSNTLCTTTSSTMGHNLTSSTDQTAEKVQIDDLALIELSVRDLNKRLHGKPKEVVQKLKQKRRTLKNRGYAQNCRTKRLHIKNEMEEELKSTKQQVKQMQKELAHLRSHCENCPIYNQQYNNLSLQGQFQRNLEDHQANQLHLSQSTHHNDLNGQSNTAQ